MASPDTTGSSGDAAQAGAPPVAVPRIRTLQLGMTWFPEQPGNGLDRVFHALTQHLPRAGVGVQGLVAGSPQVAPSADFAVEAFAPETAPLWQRLRHLRAAVPPRLLAQTDVVASHFALHALPLLDRLRARPFVVHFHGPWADESRLEGGSRLHVVAKRLIERLVYGQADRFIVLSEAFRDVLVRQFGVPAARVSIVPGGVNVERFATPLTPREARERLGWPADRPVIFSVRRLVRRVGLENLIDAMQAVRRDVPEALLFVAGKGPLADALEERIRARGLEQHARLLGFVPDADLPLAYRAADVSVVPTLALEGFGLIAAESLAAGTPPLVTPVGGLPEVVRDLSPDLVLPDSSTPALADALRGALRGTRPLPSAEACRAYARRRFDWPVIAEQTRAVYESVL